jgi:hypothetical protein
MWRAEPAESIQDAEALHVDVLEHGGVKFTFDPRYNIAYIRFREEHSDIDSVRISDDL